MYKTSIQTTGFGVNQAACSQKKGEERVFCMLVMGLQLPKEERKKRGAGEGLQSPSWPCCCYLFAHGGLQAAPRQRKPQRLAALDEALQPLVLDGQARLRGVEADDEGDVHSWGDVPLRGADGEIGLEALDVPPKPCQGKHKDRRKD